MRFLLAERKEVGDALVDPSLREPQRSARLQHHRREDVGGVARQVVVGEHGLGAVELSAGDRDLDEDPRARPDHEGDLWVPAEVEHGLREALGEEQLTAREREVGQHRGGDRRTDRRAASLCVGDGLIAHRARRGVATGSDQRCQGRCEGHRVRGLIGHQAAAGKRALGDVRGQLGRPSGEVVVASDVGEQEAFARAVAR